MCRNPALKPADGRTRFDELDPPPMQNKALKRSEQKLAALNLQLAQCIETRTMECEESEQRFRRLFEENPDACFLIGMDGRLLDGNKAVEHQTGYRLKELIGQNLLDSGIFPDGARRTAAQRIRQLKREKVLKPIEYNLTRKDGTTLIVEVTSMPISLRGEEVILSCSRDLTARKEAERELAESEAKFRSLFENMTSGVAVYEAGEDGAGFVLKDINKAGEEISAIKRQDALGHGISELFPCIKDTGLVEAVQRVGRTGNPERHPAVMYRDNQIQKWIENRIYKLQSGELVVVFDDRTKQKKFEQDLKESEEKYRSIFETESDAIMLIDGMTRRIIDVNQAAVDLYGYPRERFLKLTQKAVSADPGAPEKSILHPLDPGGRSTPYRLHRKIDGSTFPVEISARSGKLKGRLVIFGMVRDITKRVEQEKELAQNREELRRLAMELSLAEQHERERIATELHDSVSQLLSSVNLRLNMILQSTDLPASAEEPLQTTCGLIQEALQQSRLLTFKLNCPMLNELGLAAALAELCSSMNKEQQSIRFEFKGNAGLLPLHMDQKILLYRSTRELMINVIKHSQARTAAVTLEREEDKAQICVEDDGQGFDAALAGTGFSPDGGFGLFNIREYLVHAEGNLNIESVPGEGTRSVLTIPLEAEDE